jgi:flagellar motor switch protein FliN/FliY
MSNDAIANPKGPTPLLGDGLDSFMDLLLKVHAELGRTRMRIGDFLKLETSSILELPVSEGEYIGIFVNGKLVARGEVIVVEGTIAVRIAEVVNQGVV